jgi:hypothetical protein
MFSQDTRTCSSTVKHALGQLYHLHATVIDGYQQPLGVWRSVIVHDHVWNGFMNPSSTL